MHCVCTSMRVVNRKKGRRALMIIMANSSCMCAIFLLGTLWFLGVSRVSTYPADSPKGCGGVFTGWGGTITSPGYPNNYPNNARCTYDIRARRGMKIQLTFHFIDLESDHDELQLIQMEPGSKNIVTEVSGTEDTESRYTSARNRFTLLFTSDSRITKGGFRARYHVIPSGKSSSSLASECQRELYTSPSGIIKSPGYPNNYHNNADCVYEIIVQDGKRIKIDFTSFDVQGGFFGFCLHDQLEIFDGDAVVPIGMTCGSGARTFTSRGNRLFMRFMTDDSVTRPGFFGRYQTVDGPQGDVGTVNDASDKDPISKWMMRSKNKH